MPSDGKVFLGGFPMCLFISMNVFASSNVLIFFSVQSAVIQAQICLGTLKNLERAGARKFS